MKGSELQQYNYNHMVTMKNFLCYTAIRLFLLNNLTQGAYTDWTGRTTFSPTKYQKQSDAQAFCVNLKLELHLLHTAGDVAEMKRAMDLTENLAYNRVWLGNEKTISGGDVNTDFNKDGHSSYFTNTHAAWSSGQPNNAAGPQDCLSNTRYLGVGDFWCDNLRSIGEAMCTLPKCQREQTMSINNATFRISQGQIKTVNLTTLNARASPDWPSVYPTCPLKYDHTTSNDANTATVTSIVGTTMILDAQNVNKLSVNAGFWTTNHSVDVNIDNTPTVPISSIKATSALTVEVVPCAITAQTIATQTLTGATSTSSYTFPAFTWTNVESNDSLCGPIIYEFVGTKPSWLTFDAVTRLITSTPTSSGTFSYLIKAKASKFPLNEVTQNFSIVVQNCATATLTAPSSLALVGTFNIGSDVFATPITNYQHSPATLTNSCALSYSAEITAGPTGSLPPVSFPITLGIASVPLIYDPATRTFEWSQADAKYLGSWTFTLTAYSTLVPANTQTFTSMVLTVQECLNPIIVMKPGITSTTVPFQFGSIESDLLTDLPIFSVPGSPACVPLTFSVEITPSPGGIAGAAAVSLTPVTDPTQLSFQVIDKKQIGITFTMVVTASVGGSYKTFTIIRQVQSNVQSVAVYYQTECVVESLKTPQFKKFLPEMKRSLNNLQIEYSVPQTFQAPSCRLPIDFTIVKYTLKRSADYFSITRDKPIPLKLPDGLECDFSTKLYCKVDLSLLPKGTESMKIYTKVTLTNRDVTGSIINVLEREMLFQIIAVDPETVLFLTPKDGLAQKAELGQECPVINFNQRKELNSWKCKLNLKHEIIYDPAALSIMTYNKESSYLSFKQPIPTKDALSLYRMKTMTICDAQSQAKVTCFTLKTTPDVYKSSVVSEKIQVRANLTGNLTIRFSSKMDVKSLVSYTTGASTRRVIVKNRSFPAFQLLVLHKGVELDPVELDWKFVKSLNSQAIKIKIYFENTAQISQLKEFDEVKLTIRDYYNLKTDYKGMPIKPNSEGAFILRQSIRRQFTTEEERAAKTAALVVQAASGITMVLVDYFFYGFMSYLFSAVAHIEMSSHLLMVNSPRGPQQNVFVALVLAVGRFDVLPTDLLLDQHVFGDLPETIPAFQAVGYDTPALFQQMGSLFYVIPLKLGYILLLAIIVHGPECFSDSIRVKAQAWLKPYDRAYFVEHFQQLYLPINIMCMINCKYIYDHGMHSEGRAESIGNYCAIIISVLMAAAYIGLTVPICRMEKPTDAEAATGIAISKLKDFHSKNNAVVTPLAPGEGSSVIGLFHPKVLEQLKEQEEAAALKQLIEIRKQQREDNRELLEKCQSGYGSFLTQYTLAKLSKKQLLLHVYSKFVTVQIMSAILVLGPEQPILQVGGLLLMTTIQFVLLVANLPYDGVFGKTSNNLEARYYILNLLQLYVLFVSIGDIVEHAIEMQIFLNTGLSWVITSLLVCVCANDVAHVLPVVRKSCKSFCKKKKKRAQKKSRPEVDPPKEISAEQKAIIQGKQKLQEATALELEVISEVKESEPDRSARIEQNQNRVASSIDFGPSQSVLLSNERNKQLFDAQADDLVRGKLIRTTDPLVKVQEADDPWGIRRMYPDHPWGVVHKLQNTSKVTEAQKEQILTAQQSSQAYRGETSIMQAIAQQNSAKVRAARMKTNVFVDQIKELIQLNETAQISERKLSGE